MFLRKPTQSLRTTVSQEFREILAPEPGAGSMPRGVYRHVQILIPHAPEVSFIITPDEHWQLDSQANVSRDLGANRIYKGNVFPANTQIILCLGPDQSIWAAASDQYAEVGLVVEYRGES